jgi:hypothetical protein
MAAEQRRLWLVVLGLVLVFQAPLWSAYYTDDDFEDVRAVMDGTVFTGRSGFWNYNPVMGLVWLPVRHLDLEAAARYLRIINTLIQMVTPCALFLFLRRLGAPARLAGLSTLLFVLHPLGFEGGIRLCNMHYTLSLMFTLLALYAASRWMEGGGGGWAAGAVALEALALFSSFIGISAVLALVVLQALKDPDRAGGGGWFRLAALRRQLIWILPGIVYLGIFFAVLASSGLAPGRKYEQGPGMFIVFHYWMLYALMCWDPHWSVSSYIQLTGFKIMDLPLPAWALCSLLAGILLVIAVRQWSRRPWIAFAVLALAVTILVPPKPHFMPRWAYFSVPWAAVLLATLLDGLGQALTRRYSARAAAALLGVVLLAMAASSARWYARHLRDLRFCAGVTRALLHAARDTRPGPGDRLVLAQVPEGISFDKPWPRQTFFSTYQLELSLQLAGIHPAAVEIHWLDRAEDPRWPPPPAAASVPAGTLAWNGRAFVPVPAGR